MKYTVLTLVPRLKHRPLPGEEKKTGIREVGCAKCVVPYTGKLEKPCWQHKDEHILWAETVEVADETVVETPNVLGVLPVQQDEGLPYVGGAPRTEEPLEIP